MIAARIGPRDMALANAQASITRRIRSASRSLRMLVGRPGEPETGNLEIATLLRERELLLAQLRSLGLQSTALDTPAPPERGVDGSGPGHFARYMRECSAIPGWFFRESVAVWDCLLAHQRDRGVRGHLFEIGVMNGRSAALAAMHAAPDEVLALVDPAPMADARAVLAAIKPDAVRYLQARSQDLAGRPEIGDLAERCRWIHIDGEHSEAAITNDLGIANRLVSEDGVISIDDFMSTSYPHLTSAAFRYLEAHRADLSLFLCGFNKGYLCRPTAKRSYLCYLRDSLFADMAARGCGAVTVFKTNAPSELNCFGIGPRYLHFDCYGLDADQSAIVIE